MTELSSRRPATDDEGRTTCRSTPPTPTRTPGCPAWSRLRALSTAIETLEDDRVFWLGTSWKITKHPGTAEEFTSGLARWTGYCDRLRLFVLPSHTLLSQVADAHTGDVSIEMISSVGAQPVETGHSERRSRARRDRHRRAARSRRGARRRSNPREPALGVPSLGNQDGPAMVSAAVSS